MVLPGQKVGQARQQPALGKHGHTAHQQACAVRPLGHGFERVILQPQQVAHHLAVVAPPGGREARAARAALEQQHAQLGLQVADLLADGAVRDAQLLGRLTHAVVAGHGLEGQEGAGAGDVAVHGRGRQSKEV